MALHCKRLSEFSVSENHAHGSLLSLIWIDSVVDVKCLSRLKGLMLGWKIVKRTLF